VTREETLLRRLAAEVTAELASLEQLAQELAGAPSRADTYSLRARGSILHDFSSGVERIFVRIAGELNGGVPQAERWHQELLGDMVLEIPKVRPAVIDADLATALGEYLRFRRRSASASARFSRGCSATAPADRTRRLRAKPESHLDRGLAAGRCSAAEHGGRCAVGRPAEVLSLDTDQVMAGNRRTKPCTMWLSSSSLSSRSNPLDGG
jgi:hypothetical protein